jgi:hypothetical protein
VSGWTDFAATMLPALRYLYRSAGLPAWLTLAMAAHESLYLDGTLVPDSTYLDETNPWGVRPWSGSAQYGQFCGENGCFVVYPDIMAAAQNLVAALGAQRLQYASDPVAFMRDLDATGWDNGAPGYSNSVLYTYGPPAKAALLAIGVDTVTAQGGLGATFVGPYSGNTAAVAAAAAGSAALAAGLFGLLRATGHLRHRRAHGLWPWSRGA